MRRNTWLLGILGTLALSSAALAQEGMPGLTPEQQAAIDKMGAVGDEHKLLDFMVGEWTTVCKMQMDPKAPPMESTGTCTSKWILDGRFVQAEHRGTMMGKPHIGLSTTGYDTTKGKYVGSWMDNCCTGITLSEGTYDPSSKAFTYNTEVFCPIANAKIKVRYVITVKSKDSHTFEWFETRDGKESKSMEITYTRKGAA